jgi:hypothetical protein
MLSNPGRTWNRKSWVYELAFHQSMNSPDSRSRAVFRSHFCSDGRSLFPHLCRSGDEDCTRQGGGRDVMDAPLAGAMPRWRNCSAQKN